MCRLVETNVSVMMFLPVTVLLGFFCAVHGQNYVQCFRVKVETKHRLGADLKFVPHTVTKKGYNVTLPIPLSNIYQRISSEELFGRSGYPPNTICEYHFIIRKISKVYFSKIHLDVGPNDPATGIGNFRECKRVSESSFKSRDFISLNTVHSSRVFCGRPSRSVNRKVKQQKLQSNNRELIITFWSDASYSGDGFDGYFVDLRQRPPRGYRPADASKCDDTACGRITFDISWGMLEKVLDNKTESLNNLNGMDVLIEWLKSQSYSIDSEIHALWDGTPSRTSSSNRTAHTLTSFEESSTTSTPTNPSLSASTHSTRLPETVSTKQTYSSQVEKTGKSQSYSKRSSSPPFVIPNTPMEHPRVGDVNSNETNP